MLICDLATAPVKRELFDRLALHLTSLADQVELATIEASKSPKRPEWNIVASRRPGIRPRGSPVPVHF